MTRTVTYREALYEALREEMERDEAVVFLGEDLGLGGAFGVAGDLLERFGPERIIQTPISENSFVGVAVGAAMTGLRPVVEIMFMDFLTLAMDQLVNHAAKIRYMYAGQYHVPLVLRTPAGAGRGYGASHSQSLESWLIQVPGLKVVAPSDPADAKGLLKSAIRDEDPVVGDPLPAGEDELGGRDVHPLDAGPEPDLDPLLGVPLGGPHEPLLERLLPAEVLLRERRALVGRQRLLPHQDVAPVEPATPERGGGGGAGEARPDDGEGGHPRQPRGYTATCSSPPSSRTSKVSTGSAAGPSRTSPVVTSNRLPWQGHSMAVPSSSPSESEQWAWVQTSSKA